MAESVLLSENQLIDGDGNVILDLGLINGGLGLAQTKPAAAIAQTFDRGDTAIVATVVAPTSGVMKLQAIALPKDALVRSISFLSGTTAAVSPTNQWFCLCDSSRRVLAVTNNDLTAAWAASAVKTLALTQEYRVPRTGIYYLGRLITGTTLPTMTGLTTTAVLNGIPPILAGTSTSGLTTPVALNTQLAAITAGTNLEFAYVS